MDSCRHIQRTAYHRVRMYTRYNYLHSLSMFVEDQGQKDSHAMMMFVLSRYVPMCVDSVYIVRAGPRCTARDAVPKDVILYCMLSFSVVMRLMCSLNSEKMIFSCVWRRRCEVCGTTQSLRLNINRTRSKGRKCLPYPFDGSWVMTSVFRPHKKYVMGL